MATQNNCGLCNNERVRVAGQDYRIVESKYPGTQHMFLILPHEHIAQAEVSIDRQAEMFKRLFRYGNQLYPEGFYLRWNTGKYMSVPEHAHGQLYHHDGPHTAGNRNRCENCEKWDPKK